MGSEKEFDVDIIAMVYGGDAMGRLPDGRTVFVPYTLPGERVRLRLIEDKPRFAKAELVRVLSPSPDRVDISVNEDACGGCHYQHMHYQAQLRTKTQIVKDQFQRIAGIAQPPVADIIPSPKIWHYRNTVQFHFADDGRLGFQEPGSHIVQPVNHCRLCEEPLNEILPLLQFDAAIEGVDRVTLRLGADHEAMLVFESNQPIPPEVNVELPLSVVHLVYDEDGSSYPVVIAGNDHIVMENLGHQFRVSAGSFFQVNSLQAENMVRYLVENVPLGYHKTLLEVYAGVGLFSVFLAPNVGHMIAVELSSSAVDDFVVNLDETENVELYNGLAEEILPSLGKSIDVCLVDPPRAGLALPVLDSIVKHAPGFLAYVSCDPATLARDTKRLLASGYQLESVQPFDMFPQTYHIESISFFTKKT